MRVGGLAPPLFALPASRAGPNGQADLVLSSHQRLSQYRLSSRRLEDLRRTVLEAKALLASGPNRTRTAGSNVRLTGAALGLDVVGTRSRLTSTEQVNTAPTSIGDRTPHWTGSSDADIVLDGTWTGTADDTLTFVPDRDRDIPTNKGVQIEVLDGNGDRVDRFQVGQDYVPGDPITLSNGLVVRVGAGFLEGDDAATISLSATTGSAIVRTARFNGTGDGDAILEDPFEVVDGSFTLNGTTISVAATDTLDDVLDRINGLGLGVTAAYDEGTERVSITATSVGPTTITLADDTSGLLAALKLSSATTVVGRDPDPIRPLAEVPAFSSVVNGTINVNGTDVTVDVAQDSLEDVLARLSAINGIQAVFEDGRVVISGSSGTRVEVSDTSGLLDVLDVPVGSHEASRRIRGLSRQRAQELAGILHDLAAKVDAMVADQLAGPSAAAGITRLRSGLATEFKSVFEADGSRITALGGLVFDFSDGRTRGAFGSSSSERRLAKLLDDGDAETLDQLLGVGDEEGLLDRLDRFTRMNLAGLAETTRVGTRVDVRA